MDLRHFLAESEKTYRLRMKTIVPLDDAAMDKIERAVAKFNLIEIGRPKKTMLQRAPLDFPQVQSAEVYIVDMVLGLPASPSVVREDIRKALEAPELYVVVRSHNDALETETERQNAIADIEAEAKRRGLVPASLLSTDPAYEENAEIPSDTLSGTAYNGSLVAALTKVEAEKREKQKKSDNALFHYLPISKPADEDEIAAPDAFLDDIEDAPNPYAMKTTKGFAPTDIVGDRDDGTTTLSRVFRDANGKRFVLSRTLGKED